MSVYVDRAFIAYRGMLMCHMVADSLDELHVMADKIGVSRRHFQADASTPHYDICKTKRTKAVKHGAIEADRRTFVAAMRRIRASLSICAPIIRDTNTRI